MNKLSVNLAPREEAIQNGLAAWARFHLTLDRSIQGESDKEMREFFAARQVVEFGKILSFQKAAPLTYDHFRHALKTAGAEEDEETRFEADYKTLKLEAIKTRTLQSAHAYKQAVRRARMRIEEAERRFPRKWAQAASMALVARFSPLRIVRQARGWFGGRRGLFAPQNSFGISS